MIKENDNDTASQPSSIETRAVSDNIPETKTETKAVIDINTETSMNSSTSHTEEKDNDIESQPLSSYSSERRPKRGTIVEFKRKGPDNNEIGKVKHVGK